MRLKNMSFLRELIGRFVFDSECYCSVGISFQKRRVLSLCGMDVWCALCVVCACMCEKAWHSMTCVWMCCVCVYRPNIDRNYTKES